MLRWLLCRRRASTGQAGEDAAVAHLRREGYRILGRNLRNRVGEIDILAEPADRSAVVVVEVKAAGQPGSLAPEVHVNRAKRQKLVAVAATLLRQRRLTGRPVRFDVVTVTFQPDGKPTIRHHRGAFDATL